MAYLMLFLVLMVVSGALAVVEWRRLGDEEVDLPALAPPPAEPAAVTRACATESDLVTRLMRGSLDRAGYQREMAALAQGDEANRPVELPPDYRP